MLFVVVILQALTDGCWADKADPMCSTNHQCMNCLTRNESFVVCAFNYASCKDLTTYVADSSYAF